MSPLNARGQAGALASKCVTGPACVLSRLFLVGSLGAMGFVIAYLAGGGDGPISIMAVQAAGERHEAVGLTYAGLAGLTLAVTQVAGVLMAWWTARFGRARPRGAGLAALVGWAGLWLVNALWLASETDIAWRHLATLILSATFIATVIRALKDWPRAGVSRPEGRRAGPSWTRRDANDQTPVQAEPPVDGDPRILRTA